MEIRAPVDATEPPEVFARNVAVGARIWAGGIVFFFVSFLFAFFYLRALDSNGKWNEHDLNPGQGWGVPILVAVLASVLATAWAFRSLQRGEGRAWRLGAGLALALGLAAIVIQAIAYTQISFGPGDGGYAAVYFGWTGLFAVFALGMMYWLETGLAQTLREGDASLPLLRPSAEALLLTWATLGVVELAAYILLYVVR